MATIHLAAKLQSSIRTRAVWGRCETLNLHIDVGGRLFDGKSKRRFGADLEAITNLWVANRYLGVGPLEVQLIRPCVWVHEIRKCLADQEILHLRVSMTQARRGRIGTEKIPFEEESDIRLFCWN